MALKIITLPAGSGKTAWVVDHAREAGADLKRQPRVVLPSQQQVWDFKERLAKTGGAMGVKISTILDLAGEVLDLGGRYLLVLPENVQHKVLRSILEGTELEYYRSIACKPGFIRSCLSIIRELKAGGIPPGAFLDAAKDSQGGLRLVELGLIYSTYQKKLREHGWADRAGLTWLAAELLVARPDLCRDWGNIYLDGFDDLTPIQYQLIASLVERVENSYLTITGSPDGARRELVHKRFLRLREIVDQGDVEDLRIEYEAGGDPASPAALLEKRLFNYQVQSGGKISAEIELAAVPDREAEVRTALRWIRSKILAERIPPSGSALLVRDLEPYRGLISRIAREYNLPVRLQGGLPLAENPLIATILKLAKLISSGKDGLVWHEVLSLWRSPYLDWIRNIDQVGAGRSRIRQLSYAKQLEEAARWGRVIQGYNQWDEAFALLMAQEEDKEEQDSDLEDVTVGLPRGKRAAQLYDLFSDFIALITPPEELSSRERHIAWLESLLGGLDPGDLLPDGLGVTGKITESPADIAARDWKALEGLNHIFRELIWAERLLGSPPVQFSEFFRELEEIINQSSYQPQEWGEDAIFCAGCTEARGLNFQVAAVLGLAEGEFPGTIKEDPFIRDEERLQLREKYHLPLRLSVDSAEGEYFYEALTRSSRYLMITRPRIAENGSVWQASPYWEEVLRMIDIVPAVHTTRSVIPPYIAGNRGELLQIIAANGIGPALRAEISDRSILEQIRKLDRSSEIIRARTYSVDSGTLVYDGDLRDRSGNISQRYPDDHVWSASRLENYQTCPFNYFIGNLLGLEKLEPPTEGLDARQLGNIYHHILEKLYRLVGTAYSIEDLLENLPAAAESVLRDAPHEEGFRETAWWKHSQQEIMENIKLTLIRLEEIEPGYRFYAAEKRFGIRQGEEAPLTVDLSGRGKYLLRGFIDRVDINQREEIRIIDYKTSGKAGFDNRAVREGKKLQLPLYALAAQEVLALGQVKEGFYFHLLAGDPSSFKLSSYREGSLRGPEAAMERAAEKGWQAVTSIQAGNFTPQPPDQGCPDYCPAVDFCWHYRARRW